MERIADRINEEDSNEELNSVNANLCGFADRSQLPKPPGPYCQTIFRSLRILVFKV